MVSYVSLDALLLMYYCHALMQTWHLLWWLLFVNEKSDSLAIVKMASGYFLLN